MSEPSNIAREGMQCYKVLQNPFVSHFGAFWSAWSVARYCDAVIIIEVSILLQVIVRSK